jgi:hypothetical protein
MQLMLSQNSFRCIGCHIVSNGILGQSVQVVFDGADSDISAFSENIFDSLRGHVFLDRGKNIPVSLMIFDQEYWDSFDDSIKDQVPRPKRTGIVMSIKIDRTLIKVMLEAISKDHPEFTRGPLLSIRDKPRSIVFNGSLQRRFKNFSFGAISAFCISSNFSFSFENVYVISYGRKVSREYFLVHKPAAAIKGKNFCLKDINFGDFLEFLTEQKVIELIGDPKAKSQSSLGKAFSYFTFALASPRFAALPRLMWSIFCIEAALGGDRTAKAVIEKKLSALLHESERSKVISEFRNIYAKRNNLFHGTSFLPPAFADEVTLSDAMPNEESLFARDIAARIIQEHFFRRVSKLDFRTVSTDPVRD